MTLFKSSFCSRRLKSMLILSVSVLALSACSGDVERFAGTPFYTASTNNQKNIMVQDTRIGQVQQPGYVQQPVYVQPVTYNQVPMVNVAQTYNNVPVTIQKHVPNYVKIPVNRVAPVLASVNQQPAPLLAGLQQPIYTAPQNVQQLITGSITPRNAGYALARLPVANPSRRSMAPYYARIQTRKLANSTITNSIHRSSGQWASAGGTFVSVGPNDNLRTLSGRYNVPEKVLMEVNGIVDARYITPGQQLLIPRFSNASVASAGRPVSLSPQYSRVTAAPAPLMALPRRNPFLRHTASIPQLARQTGYAIALPATQLQNAGQHIVMPGETLGGISAKYGVSSSKLMAANALTNPNDLKMGQTLMLPARNQLAVQSRQNFVQIASAAVYSPPIIRQPTPNLRRGYSQSVTIVQPAQAFYGTAIPPVQLAYLTQIPKPNRNRNKYRPQFTNYSPGVTYSPDGSSLQNRLNAPLPGRVSKVVTNQGQAPLRWPVQQGTVVSNFGKRANGQINQGINIAVASGSSVRAAESGRVTYIGNTIKNYGNLILIKHPNGWVTAYAHNSEVKVQRGQQVRRGQIIGTAGKSGSAQQPQIHFELRVNQRPVDPLPYLQSGQQV
ncbi:MAG: hypothetical protein COB90_09565 [Hyphomicrobiales bacterium]|nr:MAG: hypothetical protein COB90_09565 [Hyphomicrobiales bacterium]